MSDRLKDLYPATVGSIEMMGIRRSTATTVVWNCGCERRGDRVYLCGFHDGFEAGFEASLTHGEAQS